MAFFGCVLWWQGYFRYAFRYGIGGERAFWNGAGGEKAWSSNADPVQMRILGFDNALRRLETLGDKDVVQY